MGHSGRSHQLTSMEKGFYKHYKGNTYEVIGLARHSETEELMVVYKATYQKEGENLWVRPFTLFNETITVNGQAIKRFERIPDHSL